MADFEMTAAGLRNWAANNDPHVRAAVELLVWHEHWIRRTDFHRAAIQWDGSRGQGRAGVARIRWAGAREFADSGPRGSTSELAVLDLAIAIGENRYRLSGMGHAHAKAIVRAFAEALGEEAGDGT